MPMQPSRRSFTKKPTTKKSPLGSNKLLIEKLKKRTDLLKNKLEKRTDFLKNKIKEQDKELDKAFEMINDLEADVFEIYHRNKLNLPMNKIQPSIRFKSGKKI